MSPIAPLQDRLDRIKSLLPYLLIIALVCLSYAGILSGRYLLLDRDLFWFFYPNSHYLAERLSAGSFPFWNPYSYNGEPFFAQAQPGVLYPLHWLYAVVPSEELFSRLLVLHIVLAGIFMAVLIRELGGGRAASAVGGISLAFSGITTSLITLQSSLFSFAWLPLSILFLTRALKRDSIRNSIFCGFSFWMMAIVGGMEVLMMGIPVAAAIAAFPHLFPVEPYPLGFRRRFCLFAVALTTFLATASIQLVPFIELTRYSYRTEGVDLGEALTWSVHPREWIYLILPDLFRRGREFYWIEQNWLRTFYIGVIPLILTIIFAMTARKRAIGPMILCALFFIFSAGGYLPGYADMVSYIPGLRSLRYPSKFLMIFGFLISLTAGLGYGRVQIAARSSSKPPRAMAGFLVLSSLSAIFLFLFEIGDGSIRQWLEGLADGRGLELVPNGMLHNVSRLLALSTLGTLAAYIALKGRRTATVGRGALFLLLIMDLMGAMPYATVSYPRSCLEAKPDRLIDLSEEDGYFRVLSHHKLWDRTFADLTDQVRTGTDLLIPNGPLRYHVFQSQGYRVLTLSRTDQIMGSIVFSDDPGRYRLIDLLNIRYILWPTEISRPGYRLIESSDSLYYYENRGALDRAFLAAEYRICRSGAEFQTAMMNPDFDPHRSVFLEEEPVFPANQRRLEGERVIDEEKVRILRYEPERLIIHVESRGPKFLVLSDGYFPGWRAWVDGEESRIYRANYAFRAVPVNAGQSIVEFRYEPQSFQIGALISAGSIALFTGLLGRRALARLTSARLNARFDHLPEFLRVKTRPSHQ